MHRCTFIFSLLVLFLFAACNNGRSTPASEGADKAPEAQLLRLVEKDGYTIARIYLPADTVRAAATYILVPKDAELPTNLPEGTLVRTPVDNLVIYSSVTASGLKELGSISAVKGVLDASFFKQPEIVEGLKSGGVIDAGLPASPATEKIIALRPDALLLNLYEGMDAAGVDALGVPVVKMVDNQETTPLGRAEWIKLLGVLTGQEERADSIFEATKRNYQSLLRGMSKIKRKPRVLVENMYEGIWYVPAGESFQARILADAGGDYLWKDSKGTGSLSLSFEEVLGKGRDADLWLLKLYGSDGTLEGFLRTDPRYRHFSAVGSGRVYFADTTDGRLFDEMTYHPDFILADYSEIFKAFAEGREPQKLRYFKKLQ